MKAPILIAAAAALVASPMPTPVDITAPGPSGPLAGTLIDPGKASPVVLILPGSGPTDRDGNNRMGVAAAPYRLLAEALAARGVATLRIDKRGLFGSKAAVPDANTVTITAYADDAHAWVKVLRERTGRACVWVLGHSEGGLVALAAAQRPEGICGVILVASPGRPLGTVFREQFRANPANASILAAAMGMIDSLEAGKLVASVDLPPPLDRLFPPVVQPFMIDLFAQRPADEARQLRVPLLIVQGERDLQVSMADAQALAAAAPKAKLVVVAGVNHVLKAVGEGRDVNLASYGDPTLPIAPAVVDSIAAFVSRR